MVDGLLGAARTLRALVVQAAAVSGCDLLLSEDLNDGATLAGVRIENPFS